MLTYTTNCLQFQSINHKNIVNSISTQNKSKNAYTQDITDKHVTAIAVITAVTAGYITAVSVTVRGTLVGPLLGYRTIAEPVRCSNFGRPLPVSCFYIRRNQGHPKQRQDRLRQSAAGCRQRDRVRLSLFALRLNRTFLIKSLIVVCRRIKLHLAV